MKTTEIGINKSIYILFLCAQSTLLTGIISLTLGCLIYKNVNTKGVSIRSCMTMQEVTISYFLA